MTCTGDVDSAFFGDGSINDLTVDELTDDIVAGTPIGLEDNAADGGGSGDAGDNAGVLGIHFDGGAFGLEPEAGHFGIIAKTVGGAGHTGSSANASAGSGGDGGLSSDGALIEFMSGGITSAPGGSVAISGHSEGGAGGKGGNGSSSGPDTGKGGTGGTGGLAGNVLVLVTTGTFDLSNTSDGFIAKSIGGAGGDGGEGKNTGAIIPGSAHGGVGGDGGGAGDPLIKFGDDDSGSSVSFSMTASGFGIQASSIGGDGGNAGKADTSEADGTNADGFSGGAGGATRGATVIIESGSSLEITAGKIGVLIQSIGGNGGNGSEAKSVGESTGGDGGAGAGGDVSLLDLTGSTLTVVTTGDNASHGIQLSAKGGDGGDGGSADTTLANTAAGGDGANGGGGGSAELTTDATSSLSSSTSGTLSHAVVAESLAGSGGKGGNASGAIGDADGGDGGAGGTGGGVAVTITDGTLATTGDRSQGLFARSYGGSGGDGGSASGGLGGSGGASKAPGPGGTVDVTFKGAITTEGDESNGILAQSVGGFAGDAGSASAFVAYGASSESGGNANDVTVDLENGSTITTMGDFASGIDAHSTGGGGGKGSSTSGVVALGGNGSAGGDGGSVNVTVGVATITTGGEQARGISAASHGGGGGNAGSSSGVTSIGGGGGTGGDGASASVTSSATIMTTNDYADGIFSSSIGGGGGSAHSTTGVVAIGGSGGSGGDGKDASVTINGGSISTTGSTADGVFIQSVGGGGGDGSNALSLSVALSVAIGGTAGDGGSGGDVTFSDNVLGGYSISTTGEFSRGIFAQSVGGGGGDGGYATSASIGLVYDFALGSSGGGGNGGDGGTVMVDTNAAITTAMAHAAGIFAQSVGGGGGSSGATITSSNAAGGAFSLSLGGAGGEAGGGDDVTVSTAGTIGTLGHNSIGILAQSVGGGGGNAGKVIAGNALSFGSLEVAVGGSGGKGGDGGNVMLTQGATVTTAGDNAPAVMGQSVGSGGGNSGVTVAASGASLGSVNLGLGGDGGEGGNGGDVTVISTSGASTEGPNSSAIIAQSIGGSGGISGVSGSGSAVDAGDFSLSIGGDGGSGGNGGTVMLTSSAGRVTTMGDTSVGLLAQSIGGTGGRAGYSVDANVASMGTVAISLEGNGGGGGTSGDVTVDNSSEVSTAGIYADAILAQSIAGGGGSATVAISVSGFSMGSYTQAMGGSGGAGGTAGMVTVNSIRELITEGVFSNGILAQSIGGEGGNGGLAVDAGINIGIEGSGNMSVTVGGDGGAGGVAGPVMVTNSGRIRTNDYGSAGIFAQSLGGDGGSGGSAITGEITISAETSVDLQFTVGGDGGGGGTGGDVTVMNGDIGSIFTTGDLAQGILAQSIAGNGGNGGSAYTGLLDIGGSKVDVNIDVTVGGGGGTSGVGGNVDVDNDARISTEGGSSSGIYAQSIGGNGGNGGTAMNIIGNFSGGDEEGFDGDVTVAVGGNGGIGNNGGTVKVDNSGAIMTMDTTAFAIFAQSIGGGGGDGGSADNYTLAAVFPDGGKASDAENSGLTDWDISVIVGGNGEGGGDGEAVTVTNSGDLTTAGSAAYGIYAQSVGGGGGSGGNGEISLRGNGSSSTLDAMINILESIDAAYEAYQDLSNFWGTWSADVGGKAGAAGNGGDVEVDNDGDITTTGGSGTAIFAQSIGGGGGNGGDGVGGLLTTVIVAGDGGGGGDGGTVTVNNTGTLATTGDGAMGIFVHSVGGSGGSAGDIEMIFLDEFVDLDIGMGIIVQENAGDGGNGGDISVTTDGAITTTGQAAAGIYAQSVGGGGGAAGINGFTNAYGWAGSGGNTGNGGAITVTTTAPITVTGENSVGIFAQSVSGNITGQTAGNITITVGDDITASGTQGRGILAQSEGFDSNGTIAITVAEGATVSTTEDGYETIGLLDGLNNTIINNGTIEKTEGATVNGYAVIADGGKVTIDNFGTFTGSVSLDGGFSNVFTNESGATLNLGDVFDLGKTSNILTNSGTMSPAGAGTVSVSAITGSLIQSDSGIYLVDIDLTADEGDVVEVSGTADLAGMVSVQFIDLGQAPDGQISHTIIEAAEGVTEATLTALSVSSSAVAQLSLSYPSAAVVSLDFEIDFFNDAVAGGLNSNQSEIANHIHGIFQLGALSDDLALLINAPDVDSYAALLKQLNPEIYAFGQVSTLYSMSSFNDAMLSCGKHTALYRFVEQGQCGWARMQARHLEVDESEESQEFGEIGVQLAGGAQFRLDNNWVLGAAAAYDYRSLDGNSYLASETHQFQAGLVAKRQYGASMLTASLAGGFAQSDVDRLVISGAVAHGDQNIGFASAQVGASHAFERGDLYIKPRLEFSVDYISMNGFDEHGAGDLNLAVEGQDDFFYNVQAAVEFGGEIALGNGVLLRPDLTIGVTQYLGNKSPMVSAVFESSPSGVPSFTASSGMDQTYLDIGLGLDIVSTNDWIISIDGFSRISDNTRAYGGGLKIAIRF